MTAPIDRLRPTAHQVLTTARHASKAAEAGALSPAELSRLTDGHVDAADLALARRTLDRVVEQTGSTITPNGKLVNNAQDGDQALLRATHQLAVAVEQQAGAQRLVAQLNDAKLIVPAPILDAAKNGVVATHAVLHWLAGDGAKETGIAKADPVIVRAQYKMSAHVQLDDLGAMGSRAAAVLTERVRAYNEVKPHHPIEVTSAEIDGVAAALVGQHDRNAARADVLAALAEHSAIVAVAVTRAERILRELQGA